MSSPDANNASGDKKQPSRSRSSSRRSSSRQIPNLAEGYESTSWKPSNPNIIDHSRAIAAQGEKEIMADIEESLKRRARAKEDEEKDGEGHENRGRKKRESAGSGSKDSILRAAGKEESEQGKMGQEGSENKDDESDDEAAEEEEDDDSKTVTADDR